MATLEFARKGSLPQARPPLSPLREQLCRSGLPSSSRRRRHHCREGTARAASAADSGYAQGPTDTSTDALVAMDGLSKRVLMVQDNVEKMDGALKEHFQKPGAAGVFLSSL